MAAAAPASNMPSLSFRQLPPSATLSDSEQFHLAKLNADAWPDLITASTPEGAKASIVRILLGDGAGGFDSHQTVAIPFRGVHLFAAADLNADGSTDLAVAAHDSYNVWLLFGTGQGGFSLAPQPLVIHSGSRPHTHSLTAADMNGDGLADLLTTCADDNAVAVQLQQTKAGFSAAPGSPYAAGEHPYEALTCADVNADGKLDAVVPNLLGSAFSVLLGDGTGALVQATGSPLSTAARPGSLAVGDLDGDGQLDIAVTHDDSPLLAVYFGNGDGSFAAASGGPFSSPGRMWSVVISDLDNDGSNELVGAEVGGGLLIFPGQRYTTQLPEPQRIAVTAGATMYLKLADLDANGLLDAIVSFWDNQRAAVFVQGANH